MFKILLVLLIAVPQTGYAQFLELYGLVEKSDIPADRKIYYTTGSNKFSSKKFITCDANGIYSFRMSIAEIKKSHIEFLFFAADTSQDVSIEYACVHKINTGEIIRAPEFSTLKSISLRTDLFLYEKCAGGMYYDAEQGGRGRFVGAYKFELNDTIHTITLKNIWFMCSSQLSKRTADYMDEEEGGWEYNQIEQTLIIYISAQKNEKYGLKIQSSNKYKFHVLETPGGMIFQPVSKTGVLTKL
jgi:hypothetical protein